MRVRIVFDESVREDEPVYVISKAAELAGMHPQTLRQYDRLGLVSPRRASGRGRRYSQRDVVQLVEIQRLSHEEGINLAGIKRILDLENHVRMLEARVELLSAQANPGSRVFTAGTEGDVVSVGRLSMLRQRATQAKKRQTAHRFPLQLTARVEEIDDPSAEGRKRTQARAEESAQDTSKLRSGRAVIVWSPEQP